MTPDLSSFYQHPLDYSEYVALAYGLSGIVLLGLCVAVLLKRRRFQKSLALYDGAKSL